MALAKVAMRGWKTHPGRALLTLLSVAIGVAAVLAVAMVTGTIRRAYVEMCVGVVGRTALEVTADGSRGVDEHLALSLGKVPGVEAALPVVQRPAIAYSHGWRVKLLVLGMDPRDQSVRDFELEEGQPALGHKQGQLSSEAARVLGAGVGEDIRLLGRRGLVNVHISGLVARRSAARFIPAPVLLVSLGDAQTLFGTKGRVDVIRLLLADTATPEAVAAEVANRLPEGVRVRAPGGQAELARESLVVVEQALGFAGAMSLVLAAAVILNTFLMNVSERRRQLGILRAIGATRRQIMTMILGEGALLGAGGLLLGIPLGLGGARLLTLGMEQFLAVPLPASQLTPAPYVLAGVLAVAVSMLAAWPPARTASRVSPLEAIRGSAAEPRRGAAWPVLAGGVLLLLVAVVLLTAGAAGWAPTGVLNAGNIVALAGFALLGPVVLGPATRWAAWLLAPLGKMETRLARLQILRRRTRAAVTVGVLFVAMAFAIGLGNTAVNTMQDVQGWGRRAVSGDFYIWATLPEAGTGTATEMPQTLRDELARIEGVANIDTIRAVGGRAGDVPLLVVAREFTALDRLPLDLRGGDPDQVRRRLAAGEVVIGTALAERLHLAPGDELPLDTPRGPRPLAIAAVASDYTVSGLTVYMHRATAQRLLDLEGVDAFVIDCRPGRERQTAAALRAFCDERGLLLQSAAEMRSVLDSMMAGFLAGFWALIVLGFIVAALGICNTLNMNVLEGTREFALLHVLGMTRRRVRKTILIEALNMAAVGLIPGALVGLLLSSLGNLSAMRMLGHTVVAGASPLWLAVCLLGGGAVVLVSAWLPARRAANVDPREALQMDG